MALVGGQKFDSSRVMAIVCELGLRCPLRRESQARKIIHVAEIGKHLSADAISTELSTCGAEVTFQGPYWSILT